MSVGGDGLCRLLIWIRLCSDDQSLKYFLLKYVKQVSRCSHQVKQWFMPSFAWLRAELCKHVCRHVCANTFQSFKASLGLSERYIVHVRICVCPVCVLRQISDSSQPKVISFFPLFQKTMTSWRSWKRNNETISTIVCLWDVELENHTMGVISSHLQQTADPSPFPPQFSNTSSLRKVLCYGGVLKEQSPKQHWWPWQKDALTYLHLLCVLLKLS